MRLGQIYIFTEGGYFAESQCKGLLDALNLDRNVEVKELSAPVCSFWVRWLPSPLQIQLSNLGVARLGHRESLQELSEYQDGGTLVIACGENTLSTAVELKKTFKDKVFTIVLGHPSTYDYSLFDMVIVSNFEVLQQAIDPLPSNAVKTEGMVNRVGYQSLLRSRIHSAEQLDDLRHPLLVLCLGKPTSWCQYSEKTITEDLSEICQQAIWQGAVSQVVVVFSARTPQQVQEYYTEQKWLDKWTGDFIYMLAWADLVAVTADLVCECNEVASSGKPLFTIGDDSCSPSHSAVHTFLQARGASRNLTTDSLLRGALGWRYKPLNCGSESADKVAEKLASTNSQAPRKWFRS